jgi:hypothetical protein
MPTSSAATIVACRLACGSTSARFTTAAMTASPDSSSQDTRWPSRPSSGIRTPSTIQAQNTFRL